MENFLKNVLILFVIVLIGYNVYTGAALEKVGIPGFEVSFGTSHPASSQQATDTGGDQLNESNDSTDTPSTKPEEPTQATLPFPMPLLVRMQWKVIDNRIIIDPVNKYWEQYEGNTNLSGIYLRLSDLSVVTQAVGDYLELKSDSTFELEEGGVFRQGQWKQEGDEIILTFSS